MEQIKDGAINRPERLLPDVQYKKNPLINNKGFVRDDSLKALRPKVGFREYENTLPTVRASKLANVTKYLRIRIVLNIIIGTMSMMDENEEVKFTPIAKPQGDKGCFDWPILKISGIEARTDELTLPSAHGNSYLNIKASLAFSECARKIFGDETYRSELTSKPLTQHSLQAYKYRMESIESETKGKYAKNLELYSGNEKFK